MAADLAPPRRVFAHGWWTNEGQKISKSLGNVIDPYSLIETYGLDQTRYFLMREVPFGSDGDFSHRAMVSRMNNDLANDLGNLAQRVLSMIAKNCGGSVPGPQPLAAPLAAADTALLNAAHGLLGPVRDLFAQQSFHRALETIWAVVGQANRYVDEQAPWALKKNDPERMATVLYVLAETIRHLAILVQPVTPDAAARLLDQLALPETARSFAHLGPDHALVPGTALPAPAGVFPRYSEPEAGTATGKERS
jgi:methionyl-tRNA synthetase